MNDSFNIKRKEKAPYLLDIQVNLRDPADKLQVSLRNMYRTYKSSEEMNMSMDDLNGIWHTAGMAQKEDKEWKPDLAYLFPAIREESYVYEAERDRELISDPFLPGLRVVFLDIQCESAKAVSRDMLRLYPELTEEKLKERAYRNLSLMGWQQPRLCLPSPTCKSCTIELFTDYRHPVECQFLMPDMAADHMPNHSVIAYINRNYVLLLRSEEKMDSMQKVLRLIEKSGFREVVKRSVHHLPNPVSDRIYWICYGLAAEVDFPN
ncbi:hypothetical protein [Gorillibacterium massiliense]|uniref:hypothetical protein n=1 Tax=Gorillibacterium massiliense TaxID=1280390 RepID=UPI00059348DC|nr:hypothetical protein [Gorillibacterium massiliense]